MADYAYPQLTATNPSIGVNTQPAPSSSTEIGFIDGSGNLQGVSATNPLPTSGNISDTLWLDSAGIYFVYRDSGVVGTAFPAYRIDTGALYTPASDATPVPYADFQISGNITTQNLNPTGTATAGSAVTVDTSGKGTIGLQVTGTWTAVGGLVIQATIDGVNWITQTTSNLQNVANGLYSSSISTGSVGIWQTELNGFALVRVTATGAVTGTAVVTLRAANGTAQVSSYQGPEGAIAHGWYQRITDGTSIMAVKPASTAPIATDSAAVVSLSPNGNAVTVASTTANQGTANTAANAWPIKVTDGTNIAAVKAASTAPAATDPAVVVTVSPNSADPAIGPVAPGTAATKSYMVGGVYNLTPPTLTNGQQAALQLDVDGSLFANVRDALPVGANVIGKVSIDQTTPGTTNLVSIGTNGAVGVNAGTNVIGKVGIDQTTPGTTNLVSIGTNGTVGINAAIPAGSNVIGKVSIDQTTPGTTNLVSIGTNGTVGLNAGTNLIGYVKEQGLAKANAPVYNNYATTPVTTAAYVQLIASTTAEADMMQVFDSSGQAMLIAVGAAGFEVDQVLVPPGGDSFRLAIPAASRVSIKAQTGTASSGYLIVNLLG